MKRHLLRICQFSFVVVAILSVILLAVDGISLAKGTSGEAGHSKSGGRLLGKAKTRPLTHPAPTDRLAKEYGSLPLSFEANEGQTGPSVQFVSHGVGYSLFLEKDEAVLELEKPDETDALLQKMDPKVRKRFEARKFYHASPRFRRQRKAELVHVGIAGASPEAKIRTLEQLPGKSNYFIGNDPQKWHVGIPSYQRVEYEGIYSGVDLVYYGNQRQLEFDFVVAPHADPSVINLHIQTNGRIRLGDDGSLRIETAEGSVVLHRPDIYQVADGKRTSVNGRFALRNNGEVSLQVAAYDKTRSLIIDPVLSYSTFLGGSASDFSGGIAVDSLGDAYIVGQATSTNFPTVNGYPSAANANGIAFVSELNPTGTALLYSTYLGGTGGEGGNAIALGPNASVCVTGYTFSTDFPVVNGFQTSLGTPNGNAFVSCINTTQSGTASLVYSTYLGGGGNSANSLGDTALGIAVDASGFAYVTGQTASDASVTPFPTTSGAYQTSLANPNGNAFLTVINPNQSGSASLAYSTYLGGDSTGFGDYGMGVAVDSSGDAFITGETTSGGSTPFPTTSNAYQTTLNSPNGNVFVTEIATTQSGAQSLVYSTYMGGSSTVIIGDSGSGIALDASGNVYVDGDTTSSDFPVTSAAFQTTNSTGGRAFVAKFNLAQSGTQSLIYSTYLGGTNGSEGEVANGIAVDANGDAFASGSTSSSDFPTTSDAYQTSVKNDLWNVYVTQMNPTGTGLLYSTYLGGSCNTLYGDLGFGVAVDWLGNAYIDGSTCSTDFPIYPSNAYQPALGGTYNAFIAKFALSPNPGITATASPVASASGWDSVPVTVSFACMPGAAPIESCPSPTTVSTQGANQVVSGTVEDTANNTATASVTVNIDSTPPVLSISSPANGASVSTSSVTVTGSVSDALSGVGNVMCNNVQATVSSGTFTCTLQLSMPSTTITVSASDVAGNSASSSITVNVNMAAPTSLQITPGNSNLPVGSTQSFTAVDSTSATRPDATWSVSNTSIANFVSGSPNTLSGIAAGQVTLTATIGSISAQTTVTVVSGSLSPGTVLWSATPVSGFTPRGVVPAVPSANGPDLYSVETDSNNDLLLRAFKGDGEQLWQTTNIPSGYFVQQTLGDNFGGLILGLQGSGSVAGNTIIDFNAATGAQNWQFSPANDDAFSTTAVGPTGTIYTVESATGCDEDINCPGTGDFLDVINGSTGALENQIQLPTDSLVSGSGCDGPPFSYTSPGTYGNPFVGTDGSVYLEVESVQVVDSCPSSSSTEAESLSVLQITPAGTVQYINVNSYSGPDNGYHFGIDGVYSIPDGQGGELVPWMDYSQSPPAVMIADVSPNGTVQSSFSSLQSSPSMVLNATGMAFATDDTSVVAFNVSTLEPLWTYTSTGGLLSILAATSGGGVAISDSELGVIQLDSNGNPSSLNTTDFPLNGWSGQWFNIDASSSEPEQIVLPVSVDPDGLWATSLGNPSESGAADALCDCDIQTTDPPPPPPPPADCAICKLLSPACTIQAGSINQTYLILVGDPGLNVIVNGVVHNHNVADLFNLAAQTEMKNLNSHGYPVVACRVSTIENIESDLTSYGPINGGVFYYGHAGNFGGVMVVAVGQNAGPDTNISPTNVGDLARFNSQLGPQVQITVYGCNAGYPLNNNPSIAQQIANSLRREVLAYEDGVFFSQNPNEKAKDGVGLPNPPDSLPMYPIVAGASPKSPLTPFFPQ